MAQKICFRLFGRLQNKFIGNSNIRGKFLKCFMVCSISQKNGFVFVNQIWHYKALNQYFMAQKVGFWLLMNFRTNLQKTSIQQESFWRVEPIFHDSDDSTQTFHRLQNKFLGNSNIRANFLESFNVLSRFSRKMVLCSPTKFDIIKP